ncbi:hypothetical protein [uncultured Methanobrevibacter sp.]|uniref:hypothetical protein n=1 Tax=uncultured Methanobrevibacter sp. TaxID=253161 RepID=UPI0025F597CB|nr:hypothetical protein [uncultured Methanobrevibacter sp.]
MVKKIIYYDGKFTEIPSYIYQNKNGCFEIRKRIGGVLLYWGSFPTLEEAKLYRAYYIGENWMVNPHFKTRSNRYIHEQDGLFLVRKREKGILNTFGTFDDLETAKDERDICIACNWDLDNIVEFGDSIEV